jgi:hypothetical protein
LSGSTDAAQVFVSGAWPAQQLSVSRRFVFCESLFLNRYSIL